jgi:Asp-tRNA(Asn)/Glu-tRNA(Gln) amidotransferase A subunit family amidase
MRRFALSACLAAFGLHAAAAAAQAPFRVEEATIAGFHAELRAGRTTCRAATEQHLARIAAYDQQGPRLNAILLVNPRVLEQADAMDAAFRAAPDRVGPLHCVGVVLKDNYDTADMPTTGASVSLRGATPPRDGFLVQRLRAAGALILAKANLQEFAMGGNSVSSLGGQTLNPYDLTRTPGGSSGGTGAAIAASFGLVGTGSDTGQSTRSPASANALVGIRATRGLLSRRGVQPLSVTQDEAGPITRSVADAARMLDAMAGYDPEDPVTAFAIGRIPPTYTAFLDAGGLRGARIGILRAYQGSGPEHAEVNRVTEQAIAGFRELGAEVVEIVIPDLAALTRDMGTGAFETRAALNAYLATLGPAAPVRSVEEIIASGGFHPAIGASLRARRDLAEPGAAAAYHAIFQRRDALRIAVAQAMAQAGVSAILYPHQRRLVARVGEEQLERNGVLSNATGFPAITFLGGYAAPDATAPLGVPVGMELLGPEWSEGALIRFAHAFEAGMRLRRPPASTPALN